MQSPSFLSAEKGVKHLTVQPLDPAFYTRVTNYSDAWTGLSKELEATGDEADQATSPLSTSDVSLLEELLTCTAKEHAVVGRTACQRDSHVQNLVNKKRGIGFMDKFVINCESRPMQDIYFASVARDWVANRFFFGYFGFLGLCAFLVAIGGRVLSLMIAANISSRASNGNSEAAMYGAMYLAIVKIVSVVSM